MLYHLFYFFRGFFLTRLNIFLSLIIMTFHSIAFAEESAEAAVERLFELAGVESVLDQSMAQMMDIQIQANPQLEPFKATIMKFLRKYVSYESIKPEMVKLYTDNFTAAEITEIVAFYETPTGQKAMRKMPELMQQGSLIGLRRVQENTAELQDMLMEDAARIAAEKEETPTAEPD